VGQAVPGRAWQLLARLQRLANNPGPWAAAANFRRWDAERLLVASGFRACSDDILAKYKKEGCQIYLEQIAKYCGVTPVYSSCLTAVDELKQGRCRNFDKLYCLSRAFGASHDE
jgi:hypothetical protein